MTERMRGNAIVGQSGGPTMVINRSLVGLVREAVAADEIGAVIGARHGVKGILEGDLVDLGRESEQTLARVARTPGAALGSVRKKPTRDECARILEVLRRHEIRFFFYIGGNDSAETAHIVEELAREAGYDLRLFHVPKTIDNDLRITDHCPGFGSAARFVAEAFRGDDLDNRSLPGVKIDVVMGRHAGFLTAASVLARQRDDDGPHLVYLPERAFDIESFLDDVERRVDALGRCVVAVSEGIHDAEGRLIVESHERDSHGNVQLSGSGALGDLLAARVKERLGRGLRVRADTFGYLQRSFPGVVSEVDAREAEEVGRFAVRAAVSGEHESGSIALRRVRQDPYECECFVTPLDTVARVTKSFPEEWIAPEGNDVRSQAWIEYAAPLVGELPEIGWLEGHRLEG